MGGGISDHNQNKNPPEIAKTMWIKIPQLMILWEDDGFGSVDGAAFPSLTTDGESAAGAISGAGAGAGIGGISVPKIASGSRILSTW